MEGLASRLSPTFPTTGGTPVSLWSGMLFIDYRLEAWWRRQPEPASMQLGGLFMVRLASRLSRAFPTTAVVFGMKTAKRFRAA